MSFVLWNASGVTEPGSVTNCFTSGPFVHPSPNQDMRDVQQEAREVGPRAPTSSASKGGWGSRAPGGPPGQVWEHARYTIHYPDEVRREEGLEKVGSRSQRRKAVFDEYRQLNIGTMVLQSQASPCLRSPVV